MRACVFVHARVRVGAFNAGGAEKSERLQIEAETEAQQRVLHMCVCVWTGSHTGSQISLSSPCASHSDTHTHMHAITDVTRIQEGVAAYYIPTAHARCLARLGLFKRLRLDKQRGFRSRSLLISSPFLPVSAPISPLLCLLKNLVAPPHAQMGVKKKQNKRKKRRAHTHKWHRAQLSSQESKSAKSRERTGGGVDEASYLSFC